MRRDVPRADGLFGRFFMIVRRWLGLSARVATGLAVLVVDVDMDATRAIAQSGGPLRGPEAFASIAQPAQRSIALFTEAGKVFLHPRCQNCHSADDHPRQGQDGRELQPPE